jgi:hypothetical protein
MLISVPGKECVPINIEFCTSVALGSWFNTDGWFCNMIVTIFYSKYFVPVTGYIVELKFYII